MARTLSFASGAPRAADTSELCDWEKFVDYSRAGGSFCRSSLETHLQVGCNRVVRCIHVMTLSFTYGKASEDEIMRHVIVPAQRELRTLHAPVHRSASTELKFLRAPPFTSRISEALIVRMQRSAPPLQVLLEISNSGQEHCQGRMT